MSMKFRLEDFHSEYFVETGTFHGGGVRKALAAGFSKVVSIEVFNPLVVENEERFENEIDEGKVSIVEGDSGRILKKSIDSIEGGITFWLDAHIQTMNGGGAGEEKCPIVDELRQIRDVRVGKSNILLIDDMRLIEDRGAGWSVNLSELYRLVWEIDPTFYIYRIDGHVPGDVLACVPKSRV